MKTLIDEQNDRILGFTAFGPEAGELMGTVQLAMLAGLPYTTLRDAMLAHPILIERPIVVTERGVRLCRPAAKLAEILG